MTSTRWWQYLETLMDGQTAKEAADRTGISASNFTRWKKGARADPDFVVKIARAYEANVLQALVEAEFITEEEAHLTEVAPELDLSKVSGPDLMEEVDRRLESLKYLASLSASQSPRNELAERREQKGEPEEVEPERYVAKKRNKELSEGDDGYGSGA